MAEALSPRKQWDNFINAQNSPREEPLIFAPGSLRAAQAAALDFQISRNLEEDFVLPEISMAGAQGLHTFVNDQLFADNPQIWHEERRLLQEMGQEFRAVEKLLGEPTKVTPFQAVFSPWGAAGPYLARKYEWARLAAAKRDRLNQALGFQLNQTVERRMFQDILDWAQLGGLGGVEHLRNDKFVEGLAYRANANLYEFMRSSNIPQILRAMEAHDDLSSLYLKDPRAAYDAKLVSEQLGEGGLSEEEREKKEKQLEGYQDQASSIRREIFHRLRQAVMVQTVLEDIPLPQEQTKASTYLGGRTLLYQMAHAARTQAPPDSPAGRIALQTFQRINNLKKWTPDQWLGLRKYVLANSFHKPRNALEEADQEEWNRNNLSSDADQVFQGMIRELGRLVGPNAISIVERAWLYSDRIFRLQALGIYHNGIFPKTGTLHFEAAKALSPLDFTAPGILQHLAENAYKYDLVPSGFPALSEAEREEQIKDLLRLPSVGSRGAAELVIRDSVVELLGNAYRQLAGQPFDPEVGFEIPGGRFWEQFGTGDTGQAARFAGRVASSGLEIWRAIQHGVDLTAEKMGEIKVVRNVSQGLGFDATGSILLSEDSTNPLAASKLYQHVLFLNEFPGPDLTAGPAEFYRSFGVEPNDLSPEGKRAFIDAYGKLHLNLEEKLFGRNWRKSMKDTVDRVAKVLDRGFEGKFLDKIQKEIKGLEDQIAGMEEGPERYKLQEKLAQKRGALSGIKTSTMLEFGIDMVTLGTMGLTSMLSSTIDYAADRPQDIPFFFAVDRGMRMTSEGIKRSFHTARIRAGLAHMSTKYPAGARAMLDELRQIVRSGVSEARKTKQLEVLDANLAAAVKRLDDGKRLDPRGLHALAVDSARVLGDRPAQLGDLRALVRELGEAKASIFQPIRDLGRKFFRTVMGDKTPVLSKRQEAIISQHVGRAEARMLDVEIHALLDRPEVTQKIEYLGAELRRPDLSPDVRQRYTGEIEELYRKLDDRVKELAQVQTTNPELLVAEADAGRLNFNEMPQILQKEKTKLLSEYRLADRIHAGMIKHKEAFLMAQAHSEFPTLRRAVLLDASEEVVKNRIKRIKSEIEAKQVVGAFGERQAFRAKRSQEVAELRQNLQSEQSLLNRLTKENDQIRAWPRDYPFRVGRKNLILWEVLDDENLVSIMRQNPHLFYDVGVEDFLEVAQNATSKAKIAKDLGEKKERLEVVRVDESKINRKIREIQKNPVHSDRLMVWFSSEEKAQLSALKNLKKRRKEAGDSPQALELDGEIRLAERRLQNLKAARSNREGLLKEGKIEPDSLQPARERSGQLSKESDSLNRDIKSLDLRHGEISVDKKALRSLYDLFSQRGINGLTREVRHLYRRLQDDLKDLVGYEHLRGNQSPLMLDSLPSHLRQKQLNDVTFNAIINTGIGNARISEMALMYNRMKPEDRRIFDQLRAGKRPIDDQQVKDLFDRIPDIEVVFEPVLHRLFRKVVPRSEEARLQSIKRLVERSDEFQKDILRPLLEQGVISEKKFQHWLERAYDPKVAGLHERGNYVNSKVLKELRQSKGVHVKQPGEVRMIADELRFQRHNTKWRVYYERANGDIFDQTFDNEVEAWAKVAEDLGPRFAERLKKEKGPVKEAKTSLDEPVILSDPYSKPRLDPKTGETVYDDGPLEMLDFRTGFGVFAKRLEQTVHDGQRLNMLAAFERVGGYLLDRDEYLRLLKKSGADIERQYWKLPDDPQTLGRFAGRYAHRDLLFTLAKRQQYSPYLQRMVESLQDLISDSAPLLTRVAEKMNLPTLSRLFRGMHSISQTSLILLNHVTWFGNLMFNVVLDVMTGSGVLDPLNYRRNNRILMKHSMGHRHPAVEALERSGVIHRGFFEQYQSPELRTAWNRAMGFDKKGLRELEQLKAKRVEQMRELEQGLMSAYDESRHFQLAKDLAAIDAGISRLREGVLPRFFRELGRVFLPGPDKIGQPRVAGQWLRRAYNNIDERFKAHAFLNQYLNRGVSEGTATWHVRTFFQNYAQVPAWVEATRNPFGALAGAFLYEGYRIYKNLMLYKPLQLAAFHSVVPALNTINMVRAGVDPSRFLMNLRQQGARNEVDLTWKFLTSLNVHNPDNGEVEWSYDIANAIFPISNFFQTRGLIKGFVDSVSPPEGRTLKESIALAGPQALSQLYLNSPVVNALLSISSAREPFTDRPYFPESGADLHGVTQFGGRILEMFIPPATPFIGRSWRFVNEAMDAGIDPDTGQSYRTYNPETAVIKYLTGITARGAGPGEINEAVTTIFNKYAAPILFLKEGKRTVVDPRTGKMRQATDEVRSLKLWMFRLTSEDGRSRLPEFGGPAEAYRLRAQWYLARAEEDKEKMAELEQKLRKSLEEPRKVMIEGQVVQQAPNDIDINRKLYRWMSSSVVDIFGDLPVEKQALGVVFAHRHSFSHETLRELVLASRKSLKTREDRRETNPLSVVTAKEIIKNEIQRSGGSFEWTGNRWAATNAPSYLKDYWQWLLKVYPEARKAWYKEQAGRRRKEITRERTLETAK